MSPDGNVGGVPNAGIVVGDGATSVIDPGLGRRNGEALAREVAKIRENTETYGASTRFHPDHRSGYLAFPTANYVKSTVQEAQLAESSRHAWLAAFDRFEMMRPRTIVAAHGAVRGGSLTAANRALAQGIQTRARELNVSWRPGDGVAMTVQMEFQVKFPQYPRANGVAAAVRAAYAKES